MALKMHIHSYVRSRRWVWDLMRRMPDGQYSHWDAGWSDNNDDFTWEQLS